MHVGAGQRQPCAVERADRASADNGDTGILRKYWGCGIHEQSNSVAAASAGFKPKRTARQRSSGQNRRTVGGG